MEKKSVKFIKVQDYCINPDKINFIKEQTDTHKGKSVLYVFTSSEKPIRLPDITTDQFLEMIS